MRHAIALAIPLFFIACSPGEGLTNSNGSGGSASLGGATSSGGSASAGGATSVGGSTAIGGNTATSETTATSCSVLPAEPTITFQKTCSSYVPSLGNSEVVFVDQTTTGSPGNQIVAHRFRATASCGFDVVISLPDLHFAADNQPYQMSQWWLQSANTGEVGLLAIVLRRSLGGAVLLAVAAAGSADLLNFLVSPLAVTMNGPICTNPVQAGNTSQILEINDAPLSCADEAGGNALRLCHDGDQAYRMVAYPGSPDSTELAVVFGASDGLVPLD